MTKIALSLSGGGAKGAFTAGVLHRLSMKEFFDTRPISVLSGTSTGSLIATLVARNAYAHLKQVYAGGVKTRDILGKAAGDGTFTLMRVAMGVLGVNVPTDQDELLEENVDILALAAMLDHKTSIYNIQPLKQLIRDFIGLPGFQEIIDAPDLELIYNVVSMSSGDAMTMSSKDKNRTAPEMERALWASVSQPVFMPIVDIDIPSDPVNKLFADGGLAQINPVEAIFNAKVPYDGIIAISNSPDPLKQRYTDPMADLKDVLLRTLDVLLDDVTVNDVRVPSLVMALRTAMGKLTPQQVDEVKKSFTPELGEFLGDIDFSNLRSVPIVYIRPDAPVMENGLVFSVERMTRGFEAGQQMADKMLSTLMTKFS